MNKKFKSILALFIFVFITSVSFILLNSYAQNDSEKSIIKLEECVQLLEKYKQNPEKLSQEELKKALTCLEMSKEPLPQRQQPTTIFRSPVRD